MRRVSLRLVKVCAGLREALSLITRDDYLYIRVHGVLVLFSFQGWITIMVVVLVGGFLMFFFVFQTSMTMIHIRAVLRLIRSFRPM